MDGCVARPVLILPDLLRAVPLGLPTGVGERLPRTSVLGFSVLPLRGLFVNTLDYTAQGTRSCRAANNVPPQTLCVAIASAINGAAPSGRDSKAQDGSPGYPRQLR